VPTGMRVDTAPEGSGGVTEAERLRGEAVERAVRLAKERADRALARGSASVPMAGSKRVAAEAGRPCQDPEKVTDMLYESPRTSLRVPDDSYGPY
jgi:hypothetical protein